MYTQCPHCQTCFRIAEDHLKVAKGRVRCGSCQEVFDATQYLFKNLTDREPITDFNQAPEAPPPRPSTSQPAETTSPPPRSTPQPTKTASPPPRSTPQPTKTASPPPQRTPQPTKTASPPPRSMPQPTKTASPPPQSTHSTPIHPASPSPAAVEKLIRERQKLPDQSQFMESTVGNDRYNDLDQMGAIDIPGSIDFDDSSFNFAEEASPPAESEKQPPDGRTPYEDIDAKESPATDADHEVLENFFAEVDAQLNEGEKQSQLDKDIDELLAFAKGLDQDHEPDKIDAAPTKAAPVQEENFDLQAIADFEKELETTDTGIFSIKQPEEKPPPDKPIVNIEEPAAEDQSANELESPFLDETHEASKSVHAPIEETPFPQEADVIEDLPVADEDIPRALRESLSMLDQTPRRSLGKTILLSILILVLIGGLGFQVVLFRNVELAHMFPRLIPTLTQVCGHIPCRYSGQVDVSQIKLINRDVRSDPNQANALLISATFVDQASFDQPYPDIQITLYDLGGNVVASRSFTPQEYLAKMYNRFLLMESGTPVHITLAVLDPGKDAINFEFSFH